MMSTDRSGKPADDAPAYWPGPMGTGVKDISLVTMWSQSREEARMKATLSLYVSSPMLWSTGSATAGLLEESNRRFELTLQKLRSGLSIVDGSPVISNEEVIRCSRI
jgi:hypothetical protein